MFKPQLHFATKWVQDNMPDNNTVRLMGWASLGKSFFAHVLGMFVVMDSKFVFVRDDEKANRKHEAIQVFDSEDTSDAKSGKGSGGFYEVCFVHGDKAHKFERMHKDNAKQIVGCLTKQE